MNTQPVHSAHSTQATEAAAATSPPKTLTRAADDAALHANDVHATAKAASSSLFQNAHTPTGTRVDTTR
ncbi:MAG: hypothetical protein WCC70_09350 [Candidatus Aquilonibacter sp.]